MKEYNIKFGTIEFSTKPILFQKYDWGWGGGEGVGGVCLGERKVRAKFL